MHYMTTSGFAFLMTGMLAACYTAEGEKQRYIQDAKAKCEAQGKRFVLGDVQQQGIPNLTRFTTSVTGYCIDDGRCAREGKQAYVLEEQRPGVPGKMLCIQPNQLVRIPSPFGIDALASVNIKGAAILKVAPDSIADKAGIRYDDVIYEFAGQPIGTVAELQAAVAAMRAGQQVLIRFRRNETEASVTAQF
jgi:hypothetical protein